MTRGALITIGSFDGLHRGHQALVDRTILEAKKRKLRSVALTFAVPPRMVLDPQNEQRILSDAAEKEWLLKNRGIDKVVSLAFDKKIASLNPFAFFRSVLLRQMKAKGIVVGADFRFGKARSAGAFELVRWGQEFGIPIWVIPAVRYQKKIVSSSHIRHALEAGHFKQALGFMGHPFLIRGTVEADRGVGRKLGFPTANLRVAPGKILPPGVFVVRGWIAGATPRPFKGVCNIGVRPTLTKGKRLVAEVHIFDEKRNLKGRTLFIELLHRLRSEKKFKNFEQLKRTIAHDVRRARALSKRKFSSN